MQIHALRLKPGQDLKQELVAVAEKHDLQAGFIITCVGSLQRAAIRLANKPEPTIYEGAFEIVSLVGTVSQKRVHLHISIADSTGNTIGGHLIDGSKIFTTAEVVLGEAPKLEFISEACGESGYLELVVKQRSNQ